MENFFNSLTKFQLNDALISKQNLLFCSFIIVSSYCRSQYKEKQKRKIKTKYPTVYPPGVGDNKIEELDFDAIIVGAGPAGATAAYYASHSSTLKIGLFDKKVFPRNKPCGDAWCAPALSILEEMNVLERMEKDGITHPVQRGGFVILLCL
jgi:hypothetical protein